MKKAGYTVIVGIDSTGSEAQFSIFHDKIARIVNPYSSEKLYIASILDVLKENHVDIVVPVGFIDFLLLSKYKNILEKYAIIPVDVFEKIAALSDKYYVSELAESLGINYPKTLFLRSVDIPSIKAFLDEVGLPLVVKGLGDDSKPRFTSNFNDLLNEINLRVKEGILLQEFITGVGAGYFVLSYNGEPIAEFMHKRIVEINPLGGASVKAVSNFDPDLLSFGRRVVEKTVFTGVMMVEFKKDVETGSYYLMEINPKFWGSLELAYRAGVDFPKYLVNFFLKGEKPKQITIKNTSFSWVTEAFSSYSKHGLKTLVEIIQNVLPRSPLLSDLHPHDPPNFIIKSAYTVFSFLKASNCKVSVESIYLTEHFKEILHNKLNLIISDLDGTLVRLNVPWRVVVNEALRAGLVKPYKGVNESFVQYWLTGDKRSFAKLHEFVKNYEIKASANIRKDESLLHLLGAIKQKSVYFAIVSMQSEEAITECLKKLGILDYVDAIVSREDTPLRFNALLRALEKIGVNEPHRGIMFGDTLIDIKAALRAGLVPCRVTRSHIEKLQARDLGVSYTDSVSKALRVISNLLGKL
ncbi:MAG: HAD hydrolase-like protein [Candidatus Bathyarchaeia archaeon]